MRPLAPLLPTVGRVRRARPPRACRMEDSGKVKKLNAGAFCIKQMEELIL